MAPYEIIRCDALIELQTDSITYKDGKDEKGKPTGKGKTITSPVRPDIYINTDDERELFICRKPEDLNHTTSYNMTVRVHHPLRFVKLEDTAGIIITLVNALAHARQRAGDSQQYSLGRLIFC